MESRPTNEAPGRSVPGGEALSEASSRASRVVSLAQSFSERRRGGERPSIEEYVALHPELELEIRNLFPVLCVLEELAPARPEPAAAQGAPAVASLERLGEYRIIREIGRGGMGVVYEAEQETLRRRVAIKVLPFHAFQDETQLERFRREAQAAASLHHTNIVPVFGVGEDRGVRYYVMQFIRGQTLADVLEEVRRLRAAAGSAHEPAESREPSAAGVARTLLLEQPEAVGSVGEERPAPRAAAGQEAGSDSTTSLGRDPRSAYCRSVARLGLQVAEALAYAHHEGILHRDIKPSNLLLDLKGTVWITDFGLAKVHDSAELTLSGGLVGTLRYIAPERLRGAGDTRSDVYGLGVTLYELLTLRPAFAGSDRAELMRDVAQSSPPAPRRIDPAIPRDLETVVLKAMAREPKDRYASAAAMADDLRRFVQHAPVSARRIRAPERLWRWCQRNRALAAALAAVVVLILLTLAIATVSALDLRLERDRTFERLVASKLEEGRAWRLSRKPGARARSLSALREAVTSENAGEVRSEVIASLALMDFEVESRRDIPHQVAVADEHLTRLAVQPVGGPIRVYAGVDAAEPLVTLPAAEPRAEYLWLSPGGRYLAATFAQATQRLVVWDVDRAAELFEARVPNGYRPADFDASAGRFAHVDAEGRIVVRGLPAGEVALQREERVFASSLRFSPEGKRLAAGGYGKNRNAVVVYDLESGKVLARLFHPHRTVKATWHPDGRRLAVSCWDFDVHVWDVETGRRLQCLTGHAAETTTLTYSHGGHLLASSSWANETFLWDAESGVRLAEAAGMCTAFSADDRHLGFLEGTERTGLWRVSGGEAFRLLHAPQAGKGPRVIDISPDGRWLAAASSEEGARLWCLEPLGSAHVLGALTVRSVRFHPDGSALWTGAAEGLFRWPLGQVEGSDAWRLGPPEDVSKQAALGFELAPDGRRGALLADRVRILVIDLDAGGAVLAALPHSHVANCEFSPSGRWLVSGTFQGSDVRLWDARSLTMVQSFEVGTARPRFSPDERLLAIASGPQVLVLETESWSVRATISREDAGERASPLAFTADSRFLALARSRTLLGLFEVESGAEVARFAPPMRPGDLNALAFTPDQALLAAATHHQVHVWDLRHIRAELSAVGLDWSTGEPSGGEQIGGEPIPSAPTPVSRDPASLRLDIDCGDLRPGRPESPELQAQASKLIELLTRRIELDPVPEAYMARAAALERLGDIDAALEDIDSVLAVAPDDRPALTVRGAILARRQARAETALGQQGLDGAFGAWKDLVAFNPDDAEACDNLSWVWILKRCRAGSAPSASFEDDDLVLRVAEKAHAAVPANAVRLRNLGAVYFHLGRVSEAKPLLEEARRLDARMHSATLYLAMVEHQSGRPEEARRLLDLATSEGRTALAGNPSLDQFECIRSYAESILSEPRPLSSER